MVIDAAIEDDADSVVGWEARGSSLACARGSVELAGRVALVEAQPIAEDEALGAHNPLAAAEGEHGLVAAGVVDDAEAAMHEGDVHHAAVGANGAVAEAAVAVGAAMLDGVVEDVEPGLGDGLGVGRAEREVT